MKHVIKRLWCCNETCYKEVVMYNDGTFSKNTTSETSVQYISIKPHFYIEKLGFAGVYLFFLFLLQNIDCGYSLEPPRRGGSNEYPQSMF